jgi:HEAT repeat protein
MPAGDGAALPDTTEVPMTSDQIEELLAKLADSDGGTRQRARETLVAIGEPAVPSLVGLLGSPQVRLRWEAAKTLTEIPDPAAIPGLVLLLADAEADIRWLAAIGLIGMGTRSLPDVLQSLAGGAESKGFRDACHHVLHDLSELDGAVREILKPVLTALGDMDPRELVAQRAETALHEVRALGEG